MCSAERSGGYFYTMCQTPMRRRESQPSPPPMAIVKPDRALLPSSGGTHHTTDGHGSSEPSAPHSSGALLGQSCPTGLAGLEGCRDLAGPRRGSSTGRCQHTGTSCCPGRQPTLPICTLPLFRFFPTFSPFSRGKKPKGCLEISRMLLHRLHALQQWSPAVSRGPEGWGTAHRLLPRCSNTWGWCQPPRDAKQ